MRNEARKDLSREKSSLRKTGGGKAPAPVKPTSQRITTLVMRNKYIIKLLANFTNFYAKAMPTASLL
jgi:hypothetical protein